MDFSIRPAVIEADFAQVTEFLTRRSRELINSAGVLEVADLLHTQPVIAKIVLWNMLDRNLIQMHGRCMGEAQFTL